MKAKVTGRSAWQGVPDDGYLNIHIIGDRWADAHGNATVSRYSGRLNPGKTGFGDAKNPAADLYIPVQGPGDPDGPMARFEEILVYGGETVRSEYTRRLIATDLDGLIFDYAAPEPTSLPPSFGQAPLTIQAAQQLLDTGTAKIAQVDQKLIQVTDSLAGIAQAQTDLTQRTQYAQELINTSQGQISTVLALADLSFAYAAAQSAAGISLAQDGWAVWPVEGYAAVEVESNNTTAPLTVLDLTDGTAEITYDALAFDVTTEGDAVTLTRRP